MEARLRSEIERLQSEVKALKSENEKLQRKEADDRSPTVVARQRTVGRQLTSPSVAEDSPVIASNSPLQLIVFGSLNIDMTATAGGSWPQQNASAMGKFRQSQGGKGANEAVAVARLGVRTALVGRLGHAFLISR